MSNMSYCRFQNTLNDLYDCYDHIDEIDKSDLMEKSARKSLIKLCIDIADDCRDEIEEGDRE